jgi:hypothetical protein
MVLRGIFGNFKLKFYLSVVLLSENEDPLPGTCPS